MYKTKILLRGRVNNNTRVRQHIGDNQKLVK